MKTQTFGTDCNRTTSSTRLVRYISRFNVNPEHPSPPRLPLDFFPHRLRDAHEKKENNWTMEYLQSAYANYRTCRENGEAQDKPPGELKYDGIAEWEKQPDGYYHVKYTEGPGDKAWMEEKDRNYVFRLEREGRLDELEPNLRTEVPKLYDEIIAYRNKNEAQNREIQETKETKETEETKEDAHNDNSVDLSSDVRANRGWAYLDETLQEIKKAQQEFREKQTQMEKVLQEIRVGEDSFDEFKTAKDVEGRINALESWIEAQVFLQTTEQKSQNETLENVKTFKQTIQQAVSQDKLTPLDVKQAIERILEQQKKQLEGKFNVRSSDTIKEELESLEKTARKTQENFEKEHNKLKSSADVVTSTDSQLRDLDNKLSLLKEATAPLIREYNLKQVRLKREQLILDDPKHSKLTKFYRHLQGTLNRYFVACMAIGSDEIDRAANIVSQGIGLVGEGLELIDIPIPIIGTIAKLLIKGVNYFYDQHRRNPIEQTNQFVFSITQIESIVESISQRLTLCYQTQIRELTIAGETAEPIPLIEATGIEYLKQEWRYYCSYRIKHNDHGVQTLADCAAGRILNALKNGIIRAEIDLEEQLVDCVFSSEFRQGLAGLANKDVATTSPHLGHGPWTAEGIFQRSGIEVEVHDKDRKCRRFSNNTNKEAFCGHADKYGYREGTLTEVKRLQEEKSLPLVEVDLGVETHTTTSSLNHVASDEKNEQVQQLDQQASQNLPLSQQLPVNFSPKPT